MPPSDPYTPPTPLDASPGVDATAIGDGPVVGADREVPVLPREGTIRGDGINVLRGFFMGAADTVPGVSGGTVALILGHYQRLVTAISNIDSGLVSLLTRKRWCEAAEHIDFRFLVALGIGIGGGIITFAGLMHWLLDHRMPETLAVFFGLVLASVWIVRGYVDHWSQSRVFACVGAAIVAVVISNLPIANGSDNLVYLFFSGSIAICAMILPGISGAFVLLLLGVYHQITGVIKNAVKGDISVDSILQIAIFAAGCLTGLLAFSRLLRWLLKHYHGATMAALMGLMIGSVAKLWPLQTPTTETAGLELKLRVMQYVWPSDWDGSLLSLVALAVVAAVAVIAVESYANTATSAQA